MPALAYRNRVPDPGDPVILERVQAGATLGHTIPTIAQAIGVSKPTMYSWLEQGEAQEASGELGSHAAFLNAFKEGEARFESRFLAPIQDAVAPKPGGWQPAAWLLERRLPDRWGQRREIKVEQHTTVLQLSAHVPPEALQEVRRRYLQGQDLLPPAQK